MANAEHVKLLGFWASPFVRRVEWALKLKGVDYEYIEEDIFNKSSQLLELNPVHKLVPVFVHGERVIAESFVILEYIDETWKQCPLMPQDPHERPWHAFGILFASWKSMCSLGEEKEKAAKLTVDAVEKIEGELKGKRFFGGESIGYLDIAVGWMSYWLPIWEEVGSMKILDPLQFPALTSWMRNFLEHPVIKENLPPRDKMIIYFQKRSQEFSSRPRG
ncbi:glutathione S-transferase [Salix suchowensis]|nr:glutathione S-transferase [Salix suchowensis]